MDRGQLLTYKVKKDNNIIPCIKEYNPNNCNMTNVIRSTFNALSESNTMGNCFKSKRLVIANSQAPNLRRLLSTSQCNEENIKGVNKCKNTCITCRMYLKEGKSHKFKETNTEFTVKSNFDCNTRNLIYVLICGNCELEYIGQTGTPLKKRVNTHAEQIKHERLRNLHVSQHIFKCSKGVFKIFPFYKMGSDNKHDREQKEQHFIKKFKPALNQ